MLASFLFGQTPLVMRSIVGRSLASWTSSSHRVTAVRQVFLSQSSDPSSNLALEDWLYDHHDFDHKELMLLWRQGGNVGGVRASNSRSLQVESFESVHCTFFTKKRPQLIRGHVATVCQALNTLSTRLKLDLDENDAIVVQGTNAQEVLLNTNECSLYEAQGHLDGLEERATHSVRLPLRKLLALDPDFQVSRLEEELGCVFLAGKTDSANKEAEMDEGQVSENRGFVVVRPDNQWFPGLVNGLKNETPTAINLDQEDGMHYAI